MKLPKVYIDMYRKTYFQMILLFSSNLLCFPHLPVAFALTNETDRFALLNFKESIFSDPNEVLNMWNDSIHFCKWIGVTCSSRHQRVLALELQGYELLGFISPHIGNLSFLRSLKLENNRFHGQIPVEVGHLIRLRDLVLANNTINGSIPTSLANCSGLRTIDLDGNEITGSIPIEFGYLEKLERLSMEKNNLTGSLPPSLGNISSLKQFYANFNNLEGNIPADLGRLKILSELTVGANELSGTIPSSLYNISSLRAIIITDNKLNGTLPDNIGLTLSNLLFFGIGTNKFSGRIPVTFSNISGLQKMELAFNHFWGQVPKNLGNLRELVSLSLHENNLGSNSSKDLDFLNYLTNCSKLEHIGFGMNNFGGPLPHKVGNLTPQLQKLSFWGNKISGFVPAEIGNLINLIYLGAHENLLIGSIPTSLGNCQKMQLIYLSSNRLSGQIPSSLGNLTWLFELYLYNNKLEGSIPLSIGNCRHLQSLDISHNNLSGPIPFEVIGLTSLSLLMLNLSHNTLSGNLPREVGKLININSLDLSENNLRGEIPKSIGDCLTLEYLYVQGNFFQGDIPTTLSSLKGILVMDLSRNNLSGEILNDFQKLPSSIKYLNFSFNNLEGEVPRGGIFSNASIVSVIGNNLLCGGISELKLPPCLSKKVKGKGNYTMKLVFIVICMALFFILFVAFFATYLMKKSRKSLILAFSTIREHLERISYTDLHQATNGFSCDNLIGHGPFGSVYKGIFNLEEKVIAIKVLNLNLKGATKSFVAECNALKSIRHRNLVKIITCCSSTDHKGNDFKALVFEFMANGSLDKWLHQEEEKSQSLNLLQRLNIAIDVASAVLYLHNECKESVVHCDLKPGNILLDVDMTAYVSDFGLTKLLSATTQVPQNQSSTIGLKGTIGYVAPEYGMGGKASKEGDMYSFGILLLEMFTGKCPTHGMFKDGFNLHNYVKIALPQNLFHITDPVLLEIKERQATEDICDNYCIDAKVHCCLASIFHVGIACSVKSPKERMNIKDASRKLELARDVLLSNCNYGNRSGPGY